MNKGPPLTGGLPSLDSLSIDINGVPSLKYSFMVWLVNCKKAGLSPPSGVQLPPLNGS